MGAPARERAMKEIFRKTALERLASPEQLDAALQVTDPKGWLALLACMAILASVLGWSIYGRLPTRVLGRGILVNKGGLNSVNAPTSGQVASLYVQVGSRIGKGDLVARLLQPDLEMELRNAQASQATLEEEHRRLSLFGSEEARLRSQALAQQRATVIAQIGIARERQAMLTERVAAQQKLVAEGLITEAVQQGTRDNLNLATSEIKRAQTTLAEIDLAEEQNEQRRKRESDERQRRIDEARRKVESLETKIKATSQVVSGAPGLVLEVRTAPGHFVNAGAPLVMLELTDESRTGLEALLYVPGADGKRLRPGMVVEISPSTVKREEYGAMRATVGSVAAFPATQQAMLADLGNPDLVATFFKAIDSPLLVRAELMPNPATPSGYQWTSRQGPPTTVQPGTLCNAAITVREQAPILLVVPMLRERLGL